MIYGMGKHVKEGFSKLYHTAQHREASVVNHRDVVMVTFIGISILLELCKIGSWRRYIVLGPFKSPSV